MLTAAETIRRARTRAGVSQSALAKRAGIAQSTVSRIESADLDPTWTTMQALLGAAGWVAEPIRTEAADLISTTTASRAIARSLRRGDEEGAIRDLTEAVGRLIAFEAKNPGGTPSWVTHEPTMSLGDPAWNAFLATAFAYALEQADQPIPHWMTAVPRLPHETALGDDPSPEFRAWLRSKTPPIFLEKNLLSRAEDWAIA